MLEEDGGIIHTYVDASLPSLGANPQFQTVRIFDATVFDDVAGVDGGLPVIAAILLH
jgi:hypothetical protein